MKAIAAWRGDLGDRSDASAGSPEEFAADDEWSSGCVKGSP
jgi:hypothetical protein